MQYTVANNCDEVSAPVWVEDKDNLEQRGTWRRIRVGDTAQGAYDLEPDSKIVVRCTWVIEVDGDGCAVTCRVVAER